MPLNARQQRFLDAYLVEPNATKAALAAGYSAKTAYSQGQRLLKHVEIATALASRRAEASERADLTLETHLRTLNGLRDQAAGAEQFSAAVAAEVHRGKASGFYVDKHEHRHGGAVEVRVRFEREGRRVTAS